MAHLKIAYITNIGIVS